VGMSAVAITFLATIYPCLEAARLVPAEALRYE
jgi:ABC-type lipoprotein release transport system permease subunit